MTTAICYRGHQWQALPGGGMRCLSHRVIFFRRDRWDAS
jgi:hypothetical protein